MTFNDFIRSDWNHHAVDVECPICESYTNDIFMHLWLNHGLPHNLCECGAVMLDTWEQNWEHFRSFDNPEEHVKAMLVLRALRMQV